MIRRGNSTPQLLDCRSIALPFKSIRKLVRLAQLQQTGNPEVGDSSPRLIIYFRMLADRTDFLCKPDERKTLNINVSCYVNNIIIKL